MCYCVSFSRQPLTHLHVYEFTHSRILFPFVHDGHNLGDKAEADEDGGQEESAAVEHFGVEDIRVVATAAAEHQVAQGQQEDACQHDDIVDFGKDERELVLVVFDGLFFFSHNDIGLITFSKITFDGEKGGEVREDNAHYDDDERNA